MSSELKSIRRKCIEHGKKNKSCVGCEMFQEMTFPDDKKEKVKFCILGVPVKWKIDLIRSWFTKKTHVTNEDSIGDKGFLYNPEWEK